MTEHFHLQEFVCKCGNCTTQRLNIELPLALEDLRTLIKRPIEINSAFRCPMWNKTQGGKSDSEHLEGEAVDCYVKGMDGIELAKAAWEAGFRRIGVAKNWCHLGVRRISNGVNYKVWTYEDVKIDWVKKELGLK